MSHEKERWARSQASTSGPRQGAWAGRGRRNGERLAAGPERCATRSAATPENQGSQQEGSGRATVTDPSPEHDELEARAVGEATPRSGGGRSQQRSTGGGPQIAREPPAPGRTLLDTELADAAASIQSSSQEEP